MNESSSEPTPPSPVRLPTTRELLQRLNPPPSPAATPQERIRRALDVTAQHATLTRDPWWRPCFVTRGPAGEGLALLYSKAGRDWLAACCRDHAAGLTLKPAERQAVLLVLTGRSQECPLYRPPAAVRDQLRAYVLAGQLRRLLARWHGTWTGTASELIAALDRVRPRQATSWSSRPQSFGVQLRRWRATLASAGVDLSFSRVGHAREKLVHLVLAG